MPKTARILDSRATSPSRTIGRISRCCNVSFPFMCSPPLVILPALPRRHILYQPVQLGLEGCAGGVSRRHAAGERRHRIPELSPHPLELGELRLGQQGRDGRGRLDLRGVRRAGVSGPLAPQLEAQALVGLAGDPLRQPRRPHRVLGVGVDADELAAGEGGHLDLPSLAGVGGQLGRAGVRPPGLLDGHRVPRAADPGDNGAVPDALHKFRVRPAGEGILVEILKERRVLRILEKDI